MLPSWKFYALLLYLVGELHGSCHSKNYMYKLFIGDKKINCVYCTGVMVDLTFLVNICDKEVTGARVEFGWITDVSAQYKHCKLCDIS